MNKSQVDIIQSAIKHFSEKGYFSTSVQEIADDCGMSKGSFYKYFDSKEELLIQIFEYYQDKMLQKAAKVNFDASFSPKKGLMEKIIVQIEDFLENKDFMTMLFKELPIHENQNIKLRIKRVKAVMMNWHKDCLMQAYGEKINPYIWDLVIMYQGTLQGYLFLIVSDHKAIPMEKVAEFIVDRFDNMTDHLLVSQPDPVLTFNMMREYVEFELPPAHGTSKEEQCHHLLDQMKVSVSDLPANERYRQEWLESIILLQKEMSESKPRWFLIHALLSLLEKNGQLKSRILDFKKLIDATH